MRLLKCIHFLCFAESEVIFVLSFWTRNPFLSNFVQILTPLHQKWKNLKGKEPKNLKIHAYFYFYLYSFYLFSPSSHDNVLIIILIVKNMYNSFIYTNILNEKVLYIIIMYFTKCLAYNVCIPIIII